MTEISAALTPTEWADLPEHVDAGLYSTPAAWHRTMAVANARLPEGHRGKLTRAMLEGLRELIVAAKNAAAESRSYGYNPWPDIDASEDLADALDSILPPEGT